MDPAGQILGDPDPCDHYLTNQYSILLGQCVCQLQSVSVSYLASAPDPLPGSLPLAAGRLSSLTTTALSPCSPPLHPSSPYPALVLPLPSILVLSQSGPLETSYSAVISPSGHRHRFWCKPIPRRQKLD